MKRASGWWPTILLAVILPVLAFASAEILQRHRFERLREQIVAMVYGSLDGIILGRDASGVIVLPENATTGEAKYQAGFASSTKEDDPWTGPTHNPGETQRWLMWSLSAKSVNQVKLEEFWLEATVRVMLRQERKGFLRSPRVSVILPRPPHPAIAARIDALLKARGIEYEVVAALP